MAALPGCYVPSEGQAQPWAEWTGDQPELSLHLSRTRLLRATWELLSPCVGRWCVIRRVTASLLLRHREAEISRQVMVMCVGSRKWNVLRTYRGKSEPETGAGWACAVFISAARLGGPRLWEAQPETASGCLESFWGSSLVTGYPAGLRPTVGTRSYRSYLSTPGVGRQQGRCGSIVCHPAP